MTNHPFLQLVGSDEDQTLLLTVLPREHIYGKGYSTDERLKQLSDCPGNPDQGEIYGLSITGYLFIRPSYRFGLACNRHKMIDNFDTILWEGRNRKSKQFFKIKLSEAIQERV